MLGSRFSSTVALQPAPHFRRGMLVAFSILAAMLWAIPAQAQDDDPGGFKVFWSDGLRMETNDGRFQFQFGGRMQYDWVTWGEDSDVADAVPGPLLDG